MSQFHWTLTSRSLHMRVSLHYIGSLIDLYPQDVSAELMIKHPLQVTSFALILHIQSKS